MEVGAKLKVHGLRLSNWLKCPLGAAHVASVLLVEDEALIRTMIADMLAELGDSVAGEANDLQSGLLRVCRRR
jgi:hypothetical protein